MCRHCVRRVDCTRRPRSFLPLCRPHAAQLLPLRCRGPTLYLCGLEWPTRSVKVSLSLSLFLSLSISLSSPSSLLSSRSSLLLPFFFSLLSVCLSLSLLCHSHLCTPMYMHAYIHTSIHIHTRMHTYIHACIHKTNMCKLHTRGTSDHFPC